jgi:hypothetical protein
MMIASGDTFGHLGKDAKDILTASNDAENGSFGSNKM